MLLISLCFWEGLDINEPLVIRCGEDGKGFVFTALLSDTALEAWLKDLPLDKADCSSRVMADEEDDEDEQVEQCERREEEVIAGLTGTLSDILPHLLPSVLAFIATALTGAFVTAEVAEVVTIS